MNFNDISIKLEPGDDSEYVQTQANDTIEVETKEEIVDQRPPRFQCPHCPQRMTSVNRSVNDQFTESPTLSFVSGSDYICSPNMSIITTTSSAVSVVTRSQAHTTSTMSSLNTGITSNCS